MVNILEVGSGREWKDWLLGDCIPDDWVSYDVCCVDPSFKSTVLKNNVRCEPTDILTFLKNNDINFDYIFSNNVIEHIPHTQYQYLFYLLFLNSTVNAKMVIVTANIFKIIDKLKEVNPINMNAIEFNKWYTKCQYAIYADDSPHVSVMTPDIIKYHVESEGLWTIKTIEYLNDDDPWEMTITCKSNKEQIDSERILNKQRLFK